MKRRIFMGGAISFLGCPLLLKYRDEIKSISIKTDLSQLFENPYIEPELVTKVIIEYNNRTEIYLSDYHAWRNENLLDNFSFYKKVNNTLLVKQHSYVCEYVLNLVSCVYKG